MPKAKKTTKKTTKKSSLRNAVKSVVSKLTKKTPAKKKASPKKKTVKKAADTKKASKKKTTAKKSTASKKATKKTTKKAASATKKSTAPKKAAKKNAPKAKPKGTKTKKVTKKQETDMTQAQITTKIETLEMHAPKTGMPTQENTPTIMEDRKLDTTIEEMDVAPFGVETHEDNYMQDAQLEHFRKVLIRWKQQLMTEVDSTVGHMQQDGLSFPDPIDRAAQEEGFNLELRTRDRERKLIKKIESALDMIETGDYGYCEDCGAEIGVRRLDARPTATKCIDCKTYSEIREKQSGG